MTDGGAPGWRLLPFARGDVEADVDREWEGDSHLGADGAAEGDVDWNAVSLADQVMQHLVDPTARCVCARGPGRVEPDHVRRVVPDQKAAQALPQVLEVRAGQRVCTLASDLTPADVPLVGLELDDDVLARVWIART
jgi:hypothetical protein